MICCCFIIIANDSNIIIVIIDLGYIFAVSNGPAIALLKWNRVSNSSQE